MTDENEKIGECPAKNWEISVISELQGKLDCYRFDIKEKDATISRLDQEVERLKKELAEWEASKNHMIDIIHDSTAPFLARAEQAEADLAAARKVIEGMEKLIRHAFDLPDVKWSTPAYTYISEKLDELLGGGK